MVLQTTRWNRQLSLPMRHVQTGAAYWIRTSDLHFTKVVHYPCVNAACCLVERRGFEPPVPFQVRRFSQADALPLVLIGRSPKNQWISKVIGIPYHR